MNYNETDELILMHDSIYNLSLIKLSILIKINIDYVEQSFNDLFDSNLRTLKINVIGHFNF